MKCKDVKRQLGAFLDGELPADQAEAVAEHLAECSDCAELSGRLAETDRLMKDAGSLPASEDYWRTYTDRLMQRLHQRRTVQPVPAAPVSPVLTRRARPWSASRALGAAAAVAAVVLLAYAWPHLRTEEPQFMGNPLYPLVSLEGLAATDRIPAGQVEQILATSERVLIFVGNLKTSDPQVWAKLQETIKASGVLEDIVENRSRISDLRIIAVLKKHEVILTRLVNSRPKEMPRELRDLQELVTDNAVLAETQALRRVQGAAAARIEAAH